MVGSLKRFLTGIMAIIEEQLPEAYRKDFIEFMLG